MFRPDSRRTPQVILARSLAYTWASPTTAFGLCVGVATLATGGRCQVRQGALEFHGGVATRGLRVLRAGAMTLGHVILGRDPLHLELLRPHEQAHVRQAEQWGPLFLPAYLACSAWEALRPGRHYYYDNFFERQARRACGDP